MIKSIILFLEKLVFSLYGLIKILKGSKFRAKISTKHISGNSCYILGNGPSLHQDLERCMTHFALENKIAVNYFGSSELYAQLKPNLYVLADHAYYIDNLIPGVQSRIDNLFSELNEKTNWPLTVFVPFQGLQKTRARLKDNNFISVVGYNIVNSWKGFKWFDRWVYNHQWAIVSGLNVVMVALLLAINAGFKKIFLLGVDHTWHKNIVVGEDNKIYEYDTHFYDKEKVKPIPILVDDGNKVIHLKLHEQLGYIKKVFEVYHYIQDYAKYRQVEIVNCTPASYIDAFERLKV